MKLGEEVSSTKVLTENYYRLNDCTIRCEYQTEPEIWKVPITIILIDEKGNQIGVFQRIDSVREADDKVVTWGKVG